jgi:hypothetical protein
VKFIFFRKGNLVFVGNHNVIAIVQNAKVPNIVIGTMNLDVRLSTNLSGGGILQVYHVSDPENLEW